ncbi:equilibrative nucleoside transporter 1-like isoform X3 [Sander lucioperca]|uniref:equilibrative nucleoside transporter 1-like isoform X3 n=1 Tax=Sander lucioperca TaxID=283035 RepID=UPI001653CF21|nr:equilibrative nucleoside transporter 1-like isoform X3 [Sander lucioperca]
MAVSSPRDKYFGVWLIFFMLGLGTLLPWNFFMTATMYFTSRLKDSSLVDYSANQTEAEGEHRSILEAKFNNVMTLCAMLPLLLCTCLNSFLHSLQSLSICSLYQYSSASASDGQPAHHHVCLHGHRCPRQSSSRAAALLLRYHGEDHHHQLVWSHSPGQSVWDGGAAASFIYDSHHERSGTRWNLRCLRHDLCHRGSELHDAAFGYFITACVVILLSVLSYILLPKLEFFQFYQQRNQRAEEENSVNLMNSESKAEAADPNTQQDVSMIKIFKKIWLLALSVCFTFTVTIGTFPAITADTRSTLADRGSWEGYFIPVSCFLLFNLCDWAGRSLTAACMWPGKDSLVLPVSIVCRLGFLPLFMLCNVQPRLHLPVFFHHDGWFIFFMILFAFSNGYLASLCMCFGPKNVLPHEAETAGAIMAFFLSLGLALGAALSFLFRALV